MAERNTFFGAFTLERAYAARPARVFAAFADQHVKQTWLGCDAVGAPVIERFEFVVGGREFSRAAAADGEHVFDGTYLDIVPDRRFVFAFVMYVGDRKLSASIGTVEVLPDGEGTRLIFSEQGVYFDEDGWAEREEGTAAGLAQLAALLETQTETV